MDKPNVIWYDLVVVKVQITPYGDILRKKDTSLYKRSAYPLSVERRLVVVNVLHHDLQEARGLLGRRSQVGGGEDQRVLVPLLPVQPDLKRAWGGLREIGFDVSNRGSYDAPWW